MISLNELQDLIADTLLNGNDQVAGIAIYVCVLLAVFAVFGKKNIFGALICVLPITLIFSILGVLSPDVTVMLIVMTALMLALEARARA